MFSHGEMVLYGKKKNMFICWLNKAGVMMVYRGIKTTSKQHQDRNIIMPTSPCNEYPLTPHFYIVKLGFTGVYLIFLFLL